MNGKRAYTRSIDHVDNTGGTTTTTRRQARFSFYPIFSAISGSMSATGNGKGSSSTPNNNATKVREVEDTAASDSSNVKEVKADDSITTFSREDTHTHTLSSTLESNSNNNTLVTESLSSKVTSQEDLLILGQYSSTFHSTSSFYIDQEDDADKIIMAPIPTHLSNNMDWNLDDELLDDHHDPNESSSLLSISQHSLKTASTNHSLQSDESMSGLECAGLEMGDTTASRIQNFSNIEQDSSSMSKPTDFDNDYGRHDLVIGLEPSKRGGDQIVLKSANDGKVMTERNAILEALQYLHQRRLQRIQSSITTNIDPTMTKDQDNERSIPKPNTIFIAPPPLYPSITASQTHISTRIMKSQSETTGKTSSTPPPILSASNLENCLLSPLVDVRQAVASSIPDMFRNSEKDAISLYKSLDYGNEENEIDTSYLRDLNLAHSIHSNQYSSAPTSPRSKVVVVVENKLIVEEHTQGLLFPISPPPRTQTHDSELKSKTGWVQFSEEDVLNPFSLPVHLSQMSPWKYTNKACTAADSILEEKIEKCIESILLSILERESKDTTTDTKSSLGEAMEKAMTLVIEQYSALDLFENKIMNPASDELVVVVSSPKSMISTKSDVVSIDSSKNVNVEAYLKDEASQLSESQMNDDDLMTDEVSRNDMNRKDDRIGNNAIFDQDVSVASEDSDNDDDDDERDYSYDDRVHVESIGNRYSHKVLGRLSANMGGTTGVVLHNNEDMLNEYDNNSDGELNDLENSLEVLGDDDGFDSVEGYLGASLELRKESPDVSSDGILSDRADNRDRSDRRIFLPDTIETISTGMCKNPTSIMSACSFDSFKNSTSKKDRKVVDGSLSLSFDDKDNVTDSSLVRRLYGHLLPGLIKIDKRKSGLSSWLGSKFGDNNVCFEPWDESDPDETGFIKHKVSQAQLQYLEAEYERLVKGYQLNNSFASGSPDSVSKRTSFSQNSGVTEERQVSDWKIEEDEINEEDVIDTKKRPPEDIDCTSQSGDDSPTEKRHPIHSLSTNPAFPSAKAAGTGNVGDLEIYHLPIIYKAHQTGFEPTKDLVLQPGTVFAGQYYVQSELGGAAFSVAYRCIDLNSGKKGDDGEEYFEEVCLKVIKNNKDFFDQSLDEIKILELLRQTGKCQEHNIVEMKCFFYHKEHLVIVTELLRQNLFEFGKYIAENNEPQYFTRTRLCYIARQCLISLNFIHKMGLVHSDIKPENILLSSYSKARVKVIDFGSSCYLTDRQSSYIQSRSYRAPEVVLGLPYDGKIDIWSLGCVIAEMYTGQVTFQNETVVSMLSRIESICGPFPKHMVENGRVSNQFFTPNCLLFEKLSSDQDSVDDVSIDMDEIFFNVFQPKVTTMSSRLGLEAGLLERRRTTWEDEEKALFVDFIKKLLSIDPEHRPTAAQALEHPWILSGFNISEEDLVYPPSH